MADRLGGGSGLAGSSSLLAVARHRLVHERAIVAATALTALAGLVQLAAAPIYTDAVSVGALRWSVTEAPVTATSIEVGLTTGPEAVDLIGQEVVAAVAGTVDAVPIEIGERLTSDSFGLPSLAPTDPATSTDRGDDVAVPADAGQAGADKVDLTVLMSIEGLVGHASLTEGTWPSRSAGPDEQPAAVIEAGVAEQLGWTPGQELELVRRRGGTSLTVSLVGLYRRDDPTDRFWADDDLLTEGLSDGRSFRTWGPLVVDRSVLVAGTTGRLDAAWLVDPDLSRLVADEADELTGQARVLERRVTEAVADLPAPVVDQAAGLTVATDLPTVVDEATTGVAVTRAGVVAVAAQLALLAGVAIGIGAALLVAARRDQTELARARGSGRAHLAGLAGIEAAMIVVPAAVVAPWLATAALRLAGRRGPLGAVGFPIEPTVGRGVVVVMAATALTMIALLVLPTLRDGRNGPASARGRRQDRRAGAQRAGLDLALVAITAATFWQLGRLGAGARSVVGDRFSIDPLLVVTPTLALLTGAIATLRVVPILARLADTVVARGRSLVAALVGWQLARRPGDQARTIFLLALALAIGGFAASYGATWRSSQDEQATHQVGADLRVLPDRRTDTRLPATRLVAAHEAIDGVTAAFPVARSVGPFPASAEPATVLAVDAASGAGVVEADDERRPAIVEALDALVAARPDPGGLALPGDPVAIELRVRSVEEPVQAPPEPEPEPEPDGADDAATTDDEGAADDGTDGSGTDDGSAPDEGEEVDPTFLPPAFGGRFDAVVRDGRGELHRLELGRLTADDQRLDLAADLAVGLDGGPATGIEAGSPRPPAPLTLLAIELRLSPPMPPARSVDLTVGPLTVVDADGNRSELALGRGGDGLEWRAGIDSTTRLAQAADVDLPPPGDDPGPDTGLDVALITGSIGFESSLVQVELRPEPVALPARLPIVVDEAWLAASGSSIGDAIEVSSLAVDDGAAEIVGTVAGMPTTDPDRVVALVDLPTLQLLALRPGRPIDEVDEVWLGLDPDADRAEVVATLEGPPFRSVEVADRRGLAEDLRTDPVALAAIGAYTVAAVTAAIFAVIIFAAGAAVSARQRRGEFQLLRALGLAPRQFGWWMAAEHAVLLIVAAALGAVIGIGLSLAVLPRLSLDLTGQPVYPPPRTVIPWGTVAAVQLIPIGALAGVVAVLARRVSRGTMADDLREGAE